MKVPFVIVLISFHFFFVSVSFLVNNGKEMSLPGFRMDEFKFPRFSLQPNRGHMAEKENRKDTE